MVEADKDQKTEEATSKRLQDARDEGQIASSREMATWVMFVSILIVVTWLGPPLASDLNRSLQVFLERPHQLSLQDGGMQDVLLGIVTSVAFQATIVFGLFLAASILGTMVQTGFYINPNKIKFDVGKLSLAQGLKNIFSANALAEFVKAFVKMIVIGYIAYRILKPTVSELPQLVDVPLLEGLAFLHDKVIHVIVVIMVVVTFIAVADLLYVRYSYFKSLRMTKQEVKDEHKQLEGDPLIKGRLRRIRIEKARRRMMSKVPKADVVVTNPTHYAIALQYDRAAMIAPVVVAKGADFLAQRIRELAEENEIPLVSNPPLARALYDTVDLDQPIAPEHYRAVAEIISYVYKLKK